MDTAAVSAFAEIERAHDEVGAVLADPGRSGMDAVVWLSAHLAAVQQVVHPAVLRVLDDRVLERSLARGARTTELVVRDAERVLSGDATASGLGSADIVEDLARAMEVHGRREHLALDLLARAMDADEREALVAQYREALLHAPTRPHPHTPHSGIGGAVAYRVNGFRDRVLDTMDNRHVPTPRPPESHLVPGRWGEYLLGVTRSWRTGR